MIWVEHLQCQKSTVHTMYRTVVHSGLTFGARHWMATLQLQCERLVFFMATNVPTKDSTGKPHYVAIFSSGLSAIYINNIVYENNL